MTTFIHTVEEFSHKIQGVPQKRPRLGAAIVCSLLHYSMRSTSSGHYSVRSTDVYAVSHPQTLFVHILGF